MLKTIANWLEKRREKRFERTITEFLYGLAQDKHNYKSFSIKEGRSSKPTDSQLRGTKGGFGNDPPKPIPKKRTIIENEFISFVMSLPHSPQIGLDKWEAMNGNQKITIQTGVKYDELGKERRLELPSRRFARLLLFFIFEEIQESQKLIPLYGWEIDMGSGFCHFLKRIGISHNGKQYKKVQDEIESLLSATFNGQSLMGNLYTRRDKRTVLRIAENAFSNAMCDTPIKLDHEALKDFSSSYEIDAFAFLNDRFQQKLVARTHPKCTLRFEAIQWKDLYALNGQGIGRERKYREKFKAGLSLAKQYYPPAKDVDYSDDKSIKINYKHVIPPPLL